MKPTLARFKEACPDVPEDRIALHLEQLEDDYFNRFDPDEIIEHLKVMITIPGQRSCHVQILSTPDERFICTIIARDYPFIFSLITGTMAGVGFDIEGGQVFTYRKSAPARSASSSASRSSVPFADRYMPGATRRPRPSSPATPRMIVDQFYGTPHPRVADRPWQSMLELRLVEIFDLLEKEGERGIEQAQRRVNEWVVAYQLNENHPEEMALLPVDIRIDATPEGRNRMRLRAQDTPAFLYTLSTALSLQGLMIERVHIQTLPQGVEDEIHFVDAQGRMIEDRNRLDRVRFLVLLIKQFSHFLYRAPNPQRALARFGELANELPERAEGSEHHWLDVVRNPAAMRRLARLLGTSDYLWEDFIRSQYEALTPLLMRPESAADRRADTDEPGPSSDTPDAAPPSEITEPLCPSPEELEPMLAQEMEGAVGLPEQSDRLNRFKDRNVFLIDLDQILNPHTDFGTFSLRLTRLAELLLANAFAAVEADLARSYGLPSRDDGSPGQWAVFGLGKLGGQALGYASDLELLVVYDGPGNTTGGKRGRKSHAEFFELLVRDATAVIRSRREGIFSIDLRLRPFGKDGPLACSLDAFQRYFGPGGPAHSAERLALVRLRPIARSGRKTAVTPKNGRGGDEADHVSQQIPVIRDRLIYELGLVNPDEIWELRRRQFEQKVDARRIDAKYSCGALVDLEYTVQLLQARFGGRHEEVRTPGIRQALEALSDLKLLEPQESSSLIEAYGFYRGLINGLRMLRGSAIDLLVPEEGSDELLHLARRMGYQTQGWVRADHSLLLDLDLHSALIRDFVERHFGRNRLPHPETGSPADVLLSESLEPNQAQAILHRAGLKDPEGLMPLLTEFADLNLTRPVLADGINRVVRALNDLEAKDQLTGIQRVMQLLGMISDRAELLKHACRNPWNFELLIRRLAEADAPKDFSPDTADAMVGRIMKLDPPAWIDPAQRGEGNLDRIINAGSDS